MFSSEEGPNFQRKYAISNTSGAAITESLKKKKNVGITRVAYDK